ncbi:MAG: hypothetical protein QM489_01845 [Candidatus Izemoplasma sp.]
MSDIKNLNKFIKKFNRSITTNLTKEIKFSINFKNGGKSKINLSSSNNGKVNKMIFVLSKNSKMDLNDPNELILKLFNLKTFSDLNIYRKLNKDGIKISFKVNQIEYEFIIMLFKTYNCSDNVLQGIQTKGGFNYFWIEFVDYNDHPTLILNGATEFFHKVLLKKIQNNVDITLITDWTREVLNEGFKDLNKSQQ